VPPVFGIDAETPRRRACDFRPTRRIFLDAPAPLDSHRRRTRRHAAAHALLALTHLHVCNVHPQHLETSSHCDWGHGAGAGSHGRRNVVGVPRGRTNHDTGRFFVTCADDGGGGGGGDLWHACDQHLAPRSFRSKTTRPIPAHRAARRGRHG